MMRFLLQTLTIITVSASPCLADEVAKSMAGEEISATPTQDPDRAPHTLGDVLLEAERISQLLEKVNTDIQSAGSQDNLALGRSLDPLIQAVNQALNQPMMAESHLVELMDLDVRIDSGLRQLNGTIDSLSAAVKQLETDLDQLQDSATEWGHRHGLIEARRGSDQLRELARSTQDEIQASEAMLLPARDRLLQSLEQNLRVRHGLQKAADDIAAQRDGVLHDLRSVAHVPLWQISPVVTAEEADTAHRALNARIQTIRAYVATYGSWLVFMALTLTGITLACHARAHLIIEKFLPYAHMARGARRVLQAPLASIAVTVLLAINFVPNAPVAYYDALWLILIWPTVSLARPLLGRPLQSSLLLLGILMIPMPLRTIIEYMPRLDRWILEMQAVLMAAVLAIDGYRAYKNEEARLPGWVTFLAGLLCAGLCYSAVANLQGHTGIARVLVDGILGTLAFAMVYAVAMEVLFVTSLGLAELTLLKCSRLCSKDPRGLAYLLRRALILATVFMVIFGGIYAFRIQDEATEWLARFWHSRLTLGVAEIETRALLSAGLILWLTLTLTHVSRPLLEEEIFSRLRLPAGMPFALSTLIRYGVATTGLILGLLALGIDLSKVTVLAGALGVGIGFGLQNIFNNFVSGIILLFERPVHVNDVIEIGGLRGAITRIGVRSSTIKTPHGAEVIVPNADLISKEVINWTLSDRRRRLEIEVGVAYGTSVERMLDLLVETAGEIPDVLTDPPPAAFFSGFGDSSLDFVIHAWIERYEDNFLVASLLRVAINHRLDQEGIVIPFPQREVHLTGMTKF